jgi:Glutathione S-transferase, N-terminal domain
MRVFFADGCPSAHRTRALLNLLERPVEPVVVDLKNKSAEFLALSPTGAVPLLDDDRFVLFESAVINEYLAEKFAWPDAFSSDLQQRARERLAMKRFDDVLAPLFFASVKDPAALDAKPSWRREVEVLGQTVKGLSPRGLLGLHVGPHWLRMNWVAPQAPLVVALRNAAGEFLDAAAAMPAVQAVAPDQAATTKALKGWLGLS